MSCAAPAMARLHFSAPYQWRGSSSRASTSASSGNEDRTTGKPQQRDGPVTAWKDTHWMEIQSATDRVPRATFRYKVNRPCSSFDTIRRERRPERRVERFGKAIAQGHYRRGLPARTVRLRGETRASWRSSSTVERSGTGHGSRGYRRFAMRDRLAAVQFRRR